MANPPPLKVLTKLINLVPYFFNLSQLPSYQVVHWLIIYLTHIIGTKPNEDRKCGYCVALYDFQAENAGELGFKEGQTLKLFDQIDENWYEGGLEGPDGEQTGIFPTNYVRVTQPIPTQANEVATNGA